MSAVPKASTARGSRRLTTRSIPGRSTRPRPRATGSVDFLFGWLATRTGDRDDGAWQWGGNLVVTRSSTTTSGSPCVRPRPFSNTSRCRSPSRQRPGSAAGSRKRRPGRRTDLTASPTCTSRRCPRRARSRPRSRSRRAPARPASPSAPTRRWSATTRYASNRSGAGWCSIAGRAPATSRSSSNWPLPDTGTATFRLRVLVDGSCVVAYVDDRVALSCRAYSGDAGAVGLFVSEGAASFRDVAVREPH